MNTRTKIVTRSVDSAALNTADLFQKNLVIGSSAKGERSNRNMSDVLVGSKRKHVFTEDVLTRNGVEQNHT
jgi:hypothetical protein